ncbi:MAG: DUF1080 domain-containing protein [Acidobacteria bacterium]|nr:MAG: DUF1080 domain-containing protein [Acidobacteriota bacterium]
MAFWRTAIFACAIFVGLLSPAVAADSVSLFSGKDLTGWKAFLADPAVPMEKVWSVKDGLLVCKGEPIGYLYTEKPYTSFQLLVEWRWAPGTKPGNSGVLMRINGEPKPVPRAIEAQLKSGSAGDLYGFHGMKINGDPARIRQNSSNQMLGSMTGVLKTEANEKEPGQWNTYEITVKGPSITVSVNGKQVNEAKDCEVLAGPIGLQSEGGEIHFRTVRLTPLE